jgi:hypothetical protein
VRSSSIAKTIRNALNKARSSSNRNALNNERPASNRYETPNRYGRRIQFGLPRFNFGRRSRNVNIGPGASSPRNVNMGLGPGASRPRNVNMGPVASRTRNVNMGPLNITGTSSSTAPRTRNVNMGPLNITGTSPRQKNTNINIGPPNITGTSPQQKNTNINIGPPNITGTSSSTAPRPRNVNMGPLNITGTSPQQKNTNINITGTYRPRNVGTPQQKKRQYVHHQKRGDYIYPGVGLKILKRSIHMLKKKRIQKIVKNNRTGIRKNYFEKKLLKEIRPPKRKRRVQAYKETKL